MNNSVISNPKVEVAKGTALNEKDYINSLLASLKELSKGYSVAMIEASNESLYNIHKEAFLQASLLQREVFEVMFRKGWYEMDSVDANKINNKYQTLNQELVDLNA